MINNLKNINKSQLPQFYRGSTLLIFIVFIVAPSFLNAQSNFEQDHIDELIVQLSVLDQSEAKVDVLMELSEAYGDVDCGLSKNYAKLSLNLAVKIKYVRGELVATNRLGEILMFCDMNNIGAIEKYNEAIEMASELGDQEMELLILSNIAYSNYVVDDYVTAIEYYQKILSLTENTQYEREYIQVNGYIGNIYLERGDTFNGMAYYQNIYAYESNKGFESMSIPNHYFIADYFLIKKAYDQAELFSDKAMNILMKENRLRWLAYAYYFSGKIKFEKGDILAAITFGQRGCNLAEKKGFNRERIVNYQLLTKAYQKNEDFEKSNFFLKKEYSLKDSIGRIEKLNQQHVFRQEVDHILAQRANEKAQGRLVTKDLETENDQLLIRSIAIGLGVTFVFLFIIYRRLRKSKKLYNQLEQQKEQLQKLSIVAANIEQMVMIVGPDDRIEWVNKAFEKKFGYLKVEAINRTPYELLGGEKTSLADVQKINTRIFDGNEAFETNLTQYAKNKNAFLTRLHISPIIGADNKLERYIIISHDITEEQRIAENLKELSLVASNTTNSIVILDNNQKVIWVNASFTELTGLSIQNVLGRSPLDLYNAPFLNLHEKMELQALYATHEPFTVEVQAINRLNDSKSTLSMNVTPVLDERGEFLKYISVATDITEIKALEEQYESLVEGSADMICELDLDGYFTFVNDVISHTLEYSKEELKGLHFVDLVANDHKKRVERFYAHQIHSKKMTSHIEFEVLKKNGDLIWVGQRAKLIVDDRSNITGFSIVTREISEQKKAESALKKTYENANLLSEIGMQITSTLSINDIIHQLYGNINKLMDASIFGIAVPNKSNDKLVFLQVIENGKPLEDVQVDMSDDTRLAVMCYKESKEIVISDFENEFSEYLLKAKDYKPVSGEDSSSIIYLPLIIQNRTIGVLTVQSFEIDAYDKYQKSLVKSLAAFVAIALENATLYETMEEKISDRTHEVRLQKEELEVNYFNTRLLSEIGQFVSSTLNLDSIFEELYHKVGQLMDAEIFGVRIFNPIDNVLECKYTIENGTRLEEISIDMSDKDNYNVWCVNERKGLLINDNKAEYKKYVNEIRVIQGKMANSLLYYPMIVENKMIGVITIQSFKKNAYQDYHLDILKTLASYIGTVVDNAALYDTLENKVLERTLELKEKNEDITASINYAKRLQKGILPSRHFMEQLLPESFVFFKPKDIVSGDFYWIDRTQSKILFAVVDCTGHGVPGAMMSIIGRNLIDQAVNEKGMTLPSQILNFLQVGLSSAFGQTGDKRADLYDGMDLALCCLDLKTNMLDFAGANNSLHLVQDNELIVLKGDKVGITAEYQIHKSYVNIEIEIKSGDMIYLTSDGYPDQFGGERYKKFTYARMNKLLEEIHPLSMDEQYKRLNDTLNDWKGDKTQIDDICVMGVRIP